MQSWHTIRVFVRFVSARWYSTKFRRNDSGSVNQLQCDCGTAYLRSEEASHLEVEFSWGQGSNGFGKNRVETDPSEPKNNGIKWCRATNQGSPLISTTIASTSIDSKDSDSQPAASVSTTGTEVEVSSLGPPTGKVDDVHCALSTEWWRVNDIETISFYPLSFQFRRSRLRVPTSSSHFQSLFASVSDHNSHLIRALQRSFSHRTCLRCSSPSSARRPSVISCISCRYQRPTDRPMGFQNFNQNVWITEWLNATKTEGRYFLLWFFFPLKICTKFDIHFNFLFYFIPPAHFLELERVLVYLRSYL